MVAEAHERKCESQHGHEMSRVSRVSRVGSRKEEKDKGHKDMWRISSDQEIDRISLQNLYVRRWRKWRTLPM